MIENKYPLVLVSGLAADEKIFQRQIAAFREVIPVSWVEANSADTLEDYADQLAASIADRVGNRPCYVAGLSLGGMMAPMIAQHFDTKACILIATIRKPSEFPRRYRAFYFFCRYMPRLLIVGHFIAKYAVGCLMPLARRFCSPERIVILQQHIECTRDYSHSICGCSSLGHSTRNRGGTISRLTRPNVIRSRCTKSTAGTTMY